MSDINVNFTVNTVSTEFTVDQFANVNLTVDDSILANFSVEGVYNPNGGAIGGSNTQFQYNNQGVLAGASTVTYANGNITLGNVGNVRILGGSANARLTTDGTGNLSWQVLDSNAIGNSVSNVRVNSSGDITISSNLQSNIINISSNGSFSSTQIANDVSISGNLTVGGNITYTGVTNLAVENPLIDVGGGPNNSPLTNSDPYDRGLVLHTYNNGNSFTTSAVVAANSNVIPVINAANAVTGIDIWAIYSNGAQVLPTNTVVDSVDLPNNTLTLNYGVVDAVAAGVNFYQGSDRLAFIGLIQSTDEFVVSTQNEVIDNQVVYTQLGNVRGDTWIGNVSGNNITSTQIITANRVSANLITSNNANISNTVTASNLVSNTVSATTSLNTPSIVAGQITGSGNVVFTGNTVSLGNVSAVQITGGNSGQILSTDGLGTLQWIDQNSINPVPYMNWLVNATANNQQFVNNNLANYTISNDLALFRNGVYVDPVDYTITGNTLTVNVLLYDQDTLDIIRQGSSQGGPGGGDYSNANVSRYLAVYNGNLQANNYTGNNITITESISGNTLSVTGITNFGNSVFGTNAVFTNANATTINSNTLNTGAITVTGLVTLNSNANLIVTGGVANQFLQTDGTGNLRWGDPVPFAGGANTQIQYNNQGVLAGTPNLTYNTDLQQVTVPNLVVSDQTYLGGETVIDFRTTLQVYGNLYSNNSVEFTGPNVSLGSVSNLKIFGGSNTQVLTTDGSGNLTWSSAAATYSNANVANYLPNYVGSMTFANSNLLITGGANTQILVTDGAGNLRWSNNYGNTNVAAYLATYLPNYSGNMTFANSAIKITGGSNNQILVTDGLGNLSWSNNYSNTNVATYLNTYLPNYNGNMTFANANLKITGGSNNQFLQTDGAGNIRWTSLSVAVSSIANGNSNVNVLANSSVLISSNGQANIINVSSNSTHATTVIQNDLTVTGNLSVQGTTIYANTETLVVEDPIISVGTGSNGAVLTSQDNKDRGLALHTYGNGNTYTSNGNVAINSTFIAIDDTRGILVGMPVTTLTGAIPAGTVIANVDANSLIELSAATTQQINNNQALQIGYDTIRFTGWDHSNLEFVVASNTNINNEIVTVNELANFRASTVLANVISNGNSSFSGANVSLGAVGNLKITGGSNTNFLQTDGTGNLVWNSLSNIYSNSNVANYLPLYNGAMAFANANLKINGGSNTALLTTDGAGNLRWTLPANVYSNSNVANYLPTYSGNMTFGNANIRINGGQTGQVLATDGAGNLNWITQASESLLSAEAAQFELILSGSTSTDPVTDEILEFTFSPTYTGSSALASVSRTAVTSRNWFSLAFDSTGTAVTVALGSNVAATTTDWGSTWTERTLPASRNWTDVAWGDTGGAGTWVAIAAASNRGAYSTDGGVTWTEMTMPATTSWSRVVYGAGVFVAIAGTYEGVAGTTNIAATSTDGITWTQRTMPATTGWSSITYGGGQFVAVAYGSAQAATSSNGVTWTSRTLSATGNWFDIAWDGSVYAVGGLTTSILTSPDGIVWTTRSSAVSSTHNIAAVDGMIMAFPWSGTTAYYSTDNGVNWSTLTGWSNGQYIAVSGAGQAFLAVQKNGTNTRIVTRGTSYQVTLPAHNVYQTQQLFWQALVSGSPTPTQQSESLGAAILALRPTYTVTYPSAGVVRIDTNSAGAITDAVLFTLQAALSGTLTLNVTNGTGLADGIVITDPTNSQSFSFFGAGAPQTRSQWAANLAAVESLTNYTTTVTDYASNTTITFTRTTQEKLQVSEYLQYNFFQGSNSTLAYTSNVVSAGRLLIDNGVLYNTNGNITTDPDFLFYDSNNTLSINSVVVSNLQMQQFSETYVDGGSVNGIIIPNAAAGSIYRYTLTGNITLNSISNIRAGSSMTIILVQDSFGARELTAGPLWRFANNSRALTLLANAVDIIFVFYDGTNYWASLNRGYA